MLQSEKLISVGWLLFLTNTMDTDVLKGEISSAIGNIPTELCWKVINISTQESIPKKNSR